VIKYLKDSPLPLPAAAASPAEGRKQPGHPFGDDVNLNHYIKEQKEGSIMHYQAVIKEIPKCIVFSSRQIIPNYAAFNEVVPALGSKVAAANPGLRCAEPEYCFNIFHDGEYKECNIDVEICQTVTHKGEDGDGFIFKEIPAVTVVSVMHKGAYENLGAAYAYVFRWIEENGHKVIDHPRESYIDGCWNKESVADWLTELQVPIAKQ
jgi:effector-binding domain-containing protein